jgi:hypothetical protein
MALDGLLEGNGAILDLGGVLLQTVKRCGALNGQEGKTHGCT